MAPKGPNQYSAETAGRDRKTSPISVRPSDDELAAIEEMAAQCGLSRSAFLVECAIVMGPLFVLRRLGGKP